MHCWIAEKQLVATRRSEAGELGERLVELVAHRSVALLLAEQLVCVDANETSESEE